MIAEGLKSCAVESCRLCRSSDISLLFKQVQDYISGELFDVRRCNRCGVAFTHPQPVSIHRFYPTYYRRYGRLAYATLGFLYRWRARSWVHTLGSSGMALEVGCGDGWMLRALREQGWKVVGNERTVQSTLFAATVNGLPVFVGGLEALKPEARFDLIILFQVLEHLADPLGTLQECVRLLRPGGALVVAVPNIESWQARVSGPSWFHLDVPRHLFHFSPLSLSYVLERAGLDVAAIHFVSLEHDPYGWVQSVLNRAGLPQNLLTRLLMGGAEPGTATSLAGMGTVLLSVLLLGPCVLLAMCSWTARAGALMELRARKRNGLVSPSSEIAGKGLI